MHHMEDLKQENARLQKVVDILESRPELLFCVTIDGKITYISERTLNFVKSVLPNSFSEYDPVHVNQILSDESVSIVSETVRQLTEAENAKHESISSVKEVCFRDTATYQHSIGYLRCSGVIRSSDAIEESVSSLATSDLIHSPPNPNIAESDVKNKRIKRQKVCMGSSDGTMTSSYADTFSGSNVDLSHDLMDNGKTNHDNSSSLENAIAALSSLSNMTYPQGATSNLSKSAIRSHNDRLKAASEPEMLKRKCSSLSGDDSDSDMIDINGSRKHSDSAMESMIFDTSEPEFVCVIRPAEVSIPTHRNKDNSLSFITITSLL